jgi:NAD(P)-dependent dehydrogenase (short-subunit alcohol dehydrogenase family)
MLAKKGIRANAVAPGPSPIDDARGCREEFWRTGSVAAAGQPAELGTAYVMLADQSYTPGTTVAVTGGKPFI